MSDSDRLIDALYALGDLGAGEWSLETLDARIDAELRRAIDEERKRPSATAHGRPWRTRAGRAALVLGVLIPVLVALGAIALLGRHGSSPHRTLARATGLERAFPVLGRPRSRADVVPRALLSRGFVRSEGLQVDRSRLVFNNGHAKMWLLPGTREVCLVGTHQLQAGCSSPRSVTQRGLIAAAVTRQGFASAVGELPAHTELAAHLRDGAIVRVPTNANGAFAAPFVHPALSFILRTPSGHAITLLAAP